jgi:phenylacetic acid degradation operon negative regulatory protein
VQGGLWLAAGRRDVAAAVAGLGVDDHLVVLTGEAAAPTDVADVVRRAFDTDAIARGYVDFLDRWRGPSGIAGSLSGDLAREVLLHTDWLGAVRRDPHLPAVLLPADWPAIEAESVFRDLAARWQEPARREAEATLDLVEPT